MANKNYTFLQRLPADIYTGGAPFVIKAGALLKNEETGQVLLQLKFKNISDKTIKAVSVKAAAKSVAGAELPGIEKYEYLDLSAAPNKEFGDRRAIELPDRTTRQVEVNGVEAVFADGTIWSAPSGADWEPLPAQEELGRRLSEPGLIQQYIRETTPLAAYVPDSPLDIWRCTCGQINRNGQGVCGKCGLGREQVFSALNEEELTVKKAEYDELTRQKEEENNRKKEALKKKRIKRWLVIGPIIAALLICGLVMKHVREKSAYEQGAVACLEEQNYYGAIVNYLLAKDYQGVADTICGLNNKTPVQAIIGYVDAFAVLYDDGTVYFYKDGSYGYIDNQNDLSTGYYLVDAPEISYICTLDFDEEKGKMTVSYP